MIIFKKIRYKNFLSTGNAFTEIDLNRNANTLIVGINGAGKSTILDALTFALFGKPFRDVNKPVLINSINNKDCVVEIEFSIGKKEYKIVRGMKPNIFEIYVDDVLLNQDAAARDYQEVLERGILKLTYKSFTQIVILGSASFTPFMQLKPGPRREIIEDLLDIQIFSSMNVLVKQKLAGLKDASSALKYSIDLASEKIKFQRQAIEDSKKNNDAEVERKKQDIADNETLASELSTRLNLVNKHLVSLNGKISDKSTVEQKSKKLIQIETKIESNINNIDKNIAFYHNNDTCPTCKQDIDKDFKDAIIDENTSKKAKQIEGLAGVKAEVDKINERFTQIKEILDDIHRHNLEVTRINTTITGIQKNNKKLANEINELLNKKMDADDSKLVELKEELDRLIEKQEELSTEKHYYEYSSNLLKDSGIKTKIIKQYLPIMNKLINKYLQSMDSYVNFNLDENFEESIKSRFRDEFSYHSFSEGEKMRIDLAILLTWRQIAKLKNSTNTNLLIMDEIFDSSLDNSGIEDFLKLMHEMGTDTNIFVISHKGDQFFDKFQHVIRFEKKGNFSSLKL